jgi:alginate O-acetyltransferase complex protein AlgI
LVAGPIERAKNLIPQFEKQLHFSYAKATSGLKLMLWGFFKKVVIADQLAGFVNMVYGHPENYSGLVILLTTFAFGCQIYCDFSGYSDIAIGTARLFGIDLMVNFKTPYFASSIRSFWQRWHISLSSWFRDYLFIPLGGNRVKVIIWMRNILITFTISGLWHGANLNFILWGLAHGFLYTTENILVPLIKLPQRLKNITGWVFTFITVNLCWLLFRAESGEQLILLFRKIVVLEHSQFAELQPLFIDKGVLSGTGHMLLFAFPVFLIVEFFCQRVPFDEFLASSSQWVRWTFYYLIMTLILFLGVLDSVPEFIYFQF